MIVARAVLDEGNQGRMRALAVGPRFVEQRADGVHHLEVGLLIIAADVVALTDAAARQDLADCGAMILHVEPVAHIAPIAVHRQGLAGEAVQNHEGDQLFGKLVGAVVVRAIDRESRKPVGVMVRPDQVVGGRLGSGVGAVGCKRGRFAERRIAGSERAEYRSEEHTSELQSQSNLVCRLLLEKKKKKNKNNIETKKKNKKLQ